MEKTVRCTICSTEFTDEEILEAIKCPSCGTSSLPCAISEDVLLKINWHELRILTIWAENYARIADAKDKLDETLLSTVMIISKRLEKQYPDKTKLTLFSEVREIKENGKYKITSNLDDDTKLGF
jgi:predicted  nucleic acid-binding Zn-ribbon protein